MSKALLEVKDLHVRVEEKEFMRVNEKTPAVLNGTERR